MRIAKNRIAISLLLISIVFGSYGFSCKSGNTNTDSKLRQLVRTEDDVAQTLKSIAKVVKESNLSAEDLAVIKPLLKTVGESNLQAIEVVKSVNAQGELSTDQQQRLLQIVSFASDQLVQLNNEGVLRIKNQDKRVIFNTLVITLQASVTNLVPLLVKEK